MTRLFFGCAMLALLAGCGGRPVIGTSTALTLVEATELPSAERFAPARIYPSQLLGPYDKLRIDVYGIKDMQDREILVDGAGNIAFPLAGEIAATGLTPAELAASLRQRLREKYVRDPQVSVNVIEQFGGQVTVEGAVKMPGIFPVRERMTLLRAVALARGTEVRAQTYPVLIFRTVGTQRYVAAYDLNAIRLGNYADPEVFANDVVVVNESRARQLFADIAPLLTAPLIAILNQI